MESAFRQSSAPKQVTRLFQVKVVRAYRRLGIRFAAMLILGSLAHLAIGQSYLTSTGSPSFTAPEPVELGFVDASNGNLHLSIPLGSYAQRGSSQKLPISLEYDSSIWVPYANGGTPIWEANNGPGFHYLAGWYPSYQANALDFGASPVAQGCFNDVDWTDSNGSVHAFHLNISLANGCTNTSADAFAVDSSGYHMYENSTGFQVYAPDGTLVAANESYHGISNLVRQDSNGNYISEDGTGAYGQIDTLGRKVASDGAYVGSPGITVSTSEGTALYSFSTTTINVNTNFQQSNVQETSTQNGVLRSITLPDAAQSTYYFTYDCDSSTGNAACGSPAGQNAYYGELIGITLPTGGKVSYSYLTFSDAYQNKIRRVYSRSAAGGLWTYQPQVLHSCSPNQYWPANNCEQQTTVSSPTGQTVYTFQVNNGAWPASIVKKDLQGNVLSTVTNTWDFSQPCVLINCSGANFVTLSSQQTVISTVGGSLTKQVSYSYDSPKTANKTAIKEWRYISSGSFSSVPDRATYISYLTTGTNNINRPLSITLCNNTGSSPACPGGGSIVSQSLYSYDCYSGTGCSALTPVTGIAQHDDTNFAVAYTARGNVTSISKWVSASAYLTTSFTYDSTGQVVTQTDPAGNVTHYAYADAFSTDAGNGTTPASFTPAKPTNAYVTSVMDAVGTQTTNYYWGSGKAAIEADYNQVSATSHYQDGLDRQTEEIDPIGWSLATYSSATQSDMYTAIADPSPDIACVSCQHSQATLDSWGRSASQILVNNPLGQIETDNSYDTSGRVYTQSHPYSGSSDPNHVFETAGYDALDRQILITHPDGQSQEIAYGSNVGSLGGATSQQGSTSTYGYGYPQVSEDESGNERQQWTDGFGRIIEVDEPTSSGSLTSSPLVTNYLYDAGDRLTQVIQGALTRTFTYDGLGRKISENTPEGGVVTYAYVTSSGTLCSDDPSSVCQRTDARDVISIYSYDHANRLTGVAYTIPSGQNIASMANNVCTTTPNNTSANVCYYYGQGGSAAYALGRLTEIVDPTGSESYSYDPDGRVTTVSKVISGKTYNIGYQYDAGGDVTQIKYPSGKIVQQAYNPVGQLCQIATSTTNCTPGSSYYAANFSYSTPGNLLGFNYGNGVSGSFFYTPDRMQLAYLSYAKGTSTYFNLQYSYQKASQYAPGCSSGTANNNGTIQCITDNVDSGRSLGYGYDPLLRMTSANSCGSSNFPKWGLAESFDRFGNRLTQTPTAGSGPSSSLTFSTKNQPNGYTFDQSGNMTVEPLPAPNSMTYDGENRMTAFNGSGGTAAYTYDGNGMRVVKTVSGGTTTVTIFSGSSVLAEYDNGAAPSAPSREYVYNPAAGDTTGLLAMISNGATTYYHQDHLSVRLTTDGSGNVLSQEGNLPYGEAWYQSGTGNKWLFTNYDRDSESGLDYALARYYNSRTGTFCSADPLAGDPSDPQTWNRYPYGRNNPIGNVDPSGQNFLESLIDGVLKYFGGPVAWGFFTFESALDGGQPAPYDFSGAIPVGASDHSIPYRGLGSTVQGALGLPTLADVGGPIINYQNGSASNTGTHICNNVSFWAMRGNRQHIGRQGGMPGYHIAENSGVVDPGQFGFANGPAMDYAIGDGISGSVTIQPPSYFRGPKGHRTLFTPEPLSFNFGNVRDVIGARRNGLPSGALPGENVRQALERLHHGTVLLELPGLPLRRFAGAGTGSLTLPSQVPCPQ